MNEIIRLSAHGVGVLFWREADRYVHQVSLETAAGQRLWLASVEGAADDLWPPSPPLQELHLEQRPGGIQVALLVGRAGRAHWSLSVEADGSRGTLSFDVACRSRGTADKLHSNYHCSDDCRLKAERVLLSGYEVRLLEGELRFDGVTGSGLSIGPQQNARDAGQVQTFRWRYQIGPSAVDAARDS